MNAHQIKRENEARSETHAVATLALKLADVDDFNRLLELLCVHSNKLPIEVAEQLQKFPDIADKVKSLQQQVVDLSLAIEDYEADFVKKTRQIKSLRKQIYDLQIIKRDCYKQLGLTRSGRPKHG